MIENNARIDITAHPLIDWTESVKAAGGSTHAAKDLLMMFITMLPAEMALFQHAFAEQDYEALKLAAHKMRGALCYCSIPSLLNAVIDLEVACVHEDAVMVVEHYEQILKVTNELQRLLSI
jgi:two-component system sensor histidine kinase BarA